MASSMQKFFFALRQWKKPLGVLFCLSVFLFLSSPISLNAAYDPPHNDLNGVYCASCHGQSLSLLDLQGNAIDHPLWNTGISADEAYNAICLRCHVTDPTLGGYGGNSAPLVKSHAPKGTAIKCIKCHHNHYQEQLDIGSYNKNNFFIAKGTGSVSDYSNDETTIEVTSIRATNPSSTWASDLNKLASKTNLERGALLVPSISYSSSRWPIFTIKSISITPQDGDDDKGTVDGTITVKGDASTASDFGIFYGQQIRGIMETTPGNYTYMEFYDRMGPNGFVSTSAPYGICQVCHEDGLVTHWTNIGGGTDHNPGTNCMGCHLHTSGFTHEGDGTGTVCSGCHNTGKHVVHLESMTYCSNCHDMDNMAASPKDLDKCITCHKNASTGSGPNDTGYKDGWSVPAYEMNCAGCHDGRPSGPDYPEEVASHGGHTPAATCTDCHTTHQVECHGDSDPAVNEATHTRLNPLDCPDDGPGAGALDCASCHDGPGGNITGLPKAPDFKPDWQRPRVGMRSAGHERLVSTKWIRQYDCYYCHAGSVDESFNLKDLHANGSPDVAIADEWDIVGEDPPSYAGGICSNTYCHSDGTTVSPEMREYPWTGGHEDCNSCHGHDPDKDNCAQCHADDAKHTWSPEKKWLSAMPMYANTGAGTARANSHFRHLFTGFSCDDCHAATVVGVCLDCHSEGIPAGAMGESQHINPDVHVNGKTKTVVFKNGGTYEGDTTKTCSSTVCHSGMDPVWGGSVSDSVTCLECHGTDASDVDDFGEFNSSQAKINMTQWAETGHGRPDTGDPENDKYDSGNPPANLPGIGCWYCHDNQVLHQDDDNPFRLRKHAHFENRFEKECVYCHMVGTDSECLGCHDASESLAPQLAAITYDATPRPGYGADPGDPRPDHSGYSAGGCAAADCHTSDATRHKTEAGLWSQDQKDDVQNSYVMMGVCLKCHDDDSGGQCNSCHASPEVDPKYSLGFDPGLPGSSFVKPQQAKASSFHFGYKHYVALENSVAATLDTGTVSGDAGSSMELDAVKSWAVDEWAGMTVMMTSGVSNEEGRKIKSNTATKLILERGFTNPVLDGESFKIVDPVWKGGKFCWDCHDPHGDDNIYMIQNKVATRTDGVFGRPITRAEVVFTRKQSGSDYAKSEEPFNGICNVCHTAGSQHYAADRGDTHNDGRVCTSCHEHRFTDSHSSGAPCNSCHENKPVPRHAGFGLPRDCTKCHQGVVGQNGPEGKRMNIMGQMEANSHHVQGVTVTNKHCYQCHWEATDTGLINITYHEGYNYKNHSSSPNAKVDLVIWSADDEPDVDGMTDTDQTDTVGKRPTVHDLDGSKPEGPGVPTAIEFLARNINTALPGVSIADQRAEIGKITLHCLGCHSDQNNDSVPFNDCKTPRQYAWDRTSVGARYANLDTTPWGKYSSTTYPNVAAKDEITKAFSAHGNAEANQGGWSNTTGVDDNIPNTRNGVGAPAGGGEPAYNRNVQCFDCHSSHGSMVTGTTSSYVTFNGTKNGANLKETQGGKGGYANSYYATANSDSDSVNPYAAGAGQCFDCHETQFANTSLGPGSISPWGYEETFGASAPIIGYRDNSKFVGSYSGARFAYRSGKQTVGGHFNASHNNPSSPNFGDPDVTVMGTIDGLCTPCHDPHGVSPSLGDNMAYGAPLLKGSWLTSPYKEDAPPMMGDGYSNTDGFYNYKNGWSASYKRPYPQKADPQPTGVWRTDRNTFNVVDLEPQANQPGPFNTIAEDPEQFAGLCLRCHAKNTLTDGIDNNTSFKTVDRIHETVKGWGDNDEHSLSCSKCHQPHASGLPRLMQTNCLNFNHRGQEVSGGVPDNATIGSHKYERGRFPYGWWDNGIFATYSTAICHGSATANGSAGWPNNQGWNDVTPW